MDIFGILDPDPHENLCGSETLIKILMDKKLLFKACTRNYMYIVVNVVCTGTVLWLLCNVTDFFHLS